MGAVGVVVHQRDASLELRRLRLHQVQHRLGDAEVAEQHDVPRRTRLRGGRGPTARPGTAREGPHEPPGDAVVPGDQVGRQQRGQDHGGEHHRAHLLRDVAVPRPEGQDHERELADLGEVQRGDRARVEAVAQEGRGRHHRDHAARQHEDHDEQCLAEDVRARHRHLQAERDELRTALYLQPTVQHLSGHAQSPWAWRIR